MTFGKTHIYMQKANTWYKLSTVMQRNQSIIRSLVTLNLPSAESICVYANIYLANTIVANLYN